MKHKLLKRLSLGLVYVLVTVTPAQAILGEDIKILKSYFCAPKGKPCGPVELLGRMQRYAEARKLARPLSVSFYLDALGRVQREYWLASPQNMWEMKQANSIREAIMAGRNASGSVPKGLNGVMYLYADGSKVYYRLNRGLVFSILAVDKQFDPGYQGDLTKELEGMRRIIKPK